MRKNCQRKTEQVNTDYVEIQEEIRMKLKKITLTAGVMFVNKIPFLVYSQWNGQ